MNRQGRIVVFSPSIISDMGNPQATTVRAMCQAFVDLGHDVTHLEQRGNEPLDALLGSRGYGPMRSFNERYPGIRYRQYDLPRGMERSVWFGREVATADGIVAYPGTPKAVVEEVAAFDIPRRVRFWADSEDHARDLLPLWFEAAVLVNEHSGKRTGTLAVAYDTAFSVPGDVERVTAGSLDHSEWTYIPEILLTDRYQAVERVVMTRHEAWERVLLAAGSGATVDLVDESGLVIEQIQSVPDANNALMRARQLAENMDRILAERMSG